MNASDSLGGVRISAVATRTAGNEVRVFWFLLRLAAALFVLTRRRGLASEALGMFALPPVLRPAALVLGPAASLLRRLLRTR